MTEHKKELHHSTSSNLEHKDIVKTLIEHNIILQKKTIDLIDSTNQLNKKIDRLLNVFEEASKHILEVGEDRKILELTDKLEELLDQNKNISKGLMVLESYVKNKMQFEISR